MEMERNGMEWDGMGWHGMEWNGMEDHDITSTSQYGRAARSTAPCDARDTIRKVVMARPCHLVEELHDPPFRQRGECVLDRQRVPAV